MGLKQKIVCTAILLNLLGGCGGEATDAPPPSDVKIVSTDSVTNGVDQSRPTSPPTYHPSPTPDNASLRVGLPTQAAADQFDGDGDGFMTTTEYIQSLEAMYPHFIFPEGYGFDLNTYLQYLRDDVGEGRWQLNFAYSAIGIPQECAWWMAWLDADRIGNEQAKDEALNMLTDVIANNPVFTSIRDGILESARHARLGDRGYIQQYVENFCRDQPNLITPATERQSQNARFCLATRDPTVHGGPFNGLLEWD